MPVRAFIAAVLVCTFSQPAIAAPGCPAATFAATINGCSRMIAEQKLNYRARSTVFYNRGFARQSLGDANAAVADFSAAIKLDPTNAAAFNNRGYLRAMTGDLDRALQDFNRSVALDPLLIQTFNNRAMLFKTRGEWDEAIADYDAALRLHDPHAAVVYFNRGVASQHLGNTDRALADYGEALALDPSNVDALSTRPSSTRRRATKTARLQISTRR